MSSTRFTYSFRSARRAGVPLVMVETSDASEAIRQIVKSLNGKGESTPVMRWDLVTGLSGVNRLGQDAASSIGDPMTTTRPDECLAKLAQAPEGAITIMLGAQEIVQDATVRQAIFNLRDPYKSSMRMLVMLMPIGSKLPPSIKDDVVVLSMPLPDAEEIQAMASSIVADAGLLVMDATVASKVVDGLLGLPSFAAETALAMSMSKSGVDQSSLWDRKVKAVEQTNGLSVYKGEERFSDIGGVSNAKIFLSGVITGKKSPRCIVFIDEIEKAIGSQGDTSGVSQEMLGELLRWMQDCAVAGMIFIGPPGAAKSALSKAAGNEAGVPLIEFNLSGMKGSLVGQSQANLLGAIETVNSIGQGRVLCIATCNSIGNLPPELRRRFTLGTFFFDLPSKIEREQIWALYLSRYSLSDELPPDEGWTGAEIKQCCDIADRLGISLQAAAQYIVPVAKSASEQIESLRRQATGRYISASQSGVYRYEPQANAPATGRKVEV